jgi:hypothetical protein
VHPVQGLVPRVATDPLDQVGQGGDGPAVDDASPEDAEEGVRPIVADAVEEGLEVQFPVEPGALRLECLDARRRGVGLAQGGRTLEEVDAAAA